MWWVGRSSTTPMNACVVAAVVVIVYIAGVAEVGAFCLSAVGRMSWVVLVLLSVE